MHHHSNVNLEFGFKENRARLRPNPCLRSWAFSLPLLAMSSFLLSDAIKLAKLEFRSSELPSTMAFACSECFLGLLNI